MRMQDLSGFSCGRCESHFIPADALDSFLSGRDFPNGQRQLIERAIESPASPRSLTCPSCRAKTYRLVREGVIAIDVCDLCAGLYLDRGEAEQYLLQTRGSKQLVDDAMRLVDDAMNRAEDAMNKGDDIEDVRRILETIWDVIN
jgi:Zn-finger nucleic acid-binding protein